VLHSGTAPQAGRASPKSGPSGRWPDFDTPRAITSNPPDAGKVGGTNKPSLSPRSARDTAVGGGCTLAPTP